MSQWRTRKKPSRNDAPTPLFRLLLPPLKQDCQKCWKAGEWFCRCAHHERREVRERQEAAWRAEAVANAKKARTWLNQDESRRRRVRTPIGEDKICRM